MASHLSRVICSVVVVVVVVLCLHRGRPTTPDVRRSGAELHLKFLKWVVEKKFSAMRANTLSDMASCRFHFSS